MRRNTSSQGRKRPLDPPFVGPRPYERADGSLLFGREREVQQVLSLMVAYRVTVLHGVSGCGLTSFVKAGLLPRLDNDEFFQVLPVTYVRPFVEGAPSHAPRNVYVFNALSYLSSTSAVDLTAAMPKMPKARLVHARLGDYLASLPHSLAYDDQPAARILIFDQFEELFTSHPEHWSHRSGFFSEIADAISRDATLRILFALRSEYLAELDRYRHLLIGGLRARFRLNLLNREQALKAILGPMEVAGLTFASGVAEELVDDLMRFGVDTKVGEYFEANTEFVEPVHLQVVCRGLWNDLPPNISVITRSHIRRVGDSNDVLCRFVTESLMRLSQATGLTTRELGEWLEDTFITPSGTRNTVYRYRAVTSGMPNSVLDELERHHLIRAEWRAGAMWYQLTHDRLITPIRMANHKLRR